MLDPGAETVFYGWRLREKEKRLRWLPSEAESHPRFFESPLKEPLHSTRKRRGEWKRVQDFAGFAAAPFHRATKASIPAWLRLSREVL